MTTPILALQLYSVRDFTENDLRGTLQKIKDMGYNAVELAGMYGLSAPEFKTVLDEIGLCAFSAHVPYQAFADDMEGTINAYKTLGCKVVAIPYLVKDQLPGGQNWPTVRQTIAKAIEVCKKAGMPLLYHIHNAEFDKLPTGEYILDKLFADLPGLAVELDTGWMRVSNVCPITWIKKYAGRCPIVHLRDTKVPSDGFQDRPIGHGDLDVPDIIETSIAGGAFAFVVEIAVSVEMTALEAAQKSIEYLKTLS